MEHAWRIIVQLDANAVSFLNHVAIGDDVALGINHNSGAERALTNGPAARTTTTGTTEKPVKEIVERILIVGTAGSSAGSSTTTALRSLDSRFGIDVDHAGLKLFRNIRKLIGELLRGRHGQGSGVRSLF